MRASCPPHCPLLPPPPPPSGPSRLELDHDLDIALALFGALEDMALAEEKGPISGLSGRATSSSSVDGNTGAGAGAGAAFATCWRPFQMAALPTAALAMLR